MINSTVNNRVKRIVRLQTAARAREQENSYVIEGSRMFLEAPEDEISEIYVMADFLEKYRRQQQEISDKAERLGYEIVSEEVFRKISDTKAPQGVLCVMRRQQTKLPGLLERQRKAPPFFLLLEDIRDPGNLGTILRVGEGAGVNGFIMNKGCADIYHPKTIRATMGSVFRVPFTCTEDMPKAIEHLQSAGIKIYAAHLSGTCFYDECDYRSGSAFLLGNEGNGLEEQTAASADTKIRIPMEGNVESLNVAVAAAILSYECHRQRARQNTR